MGYEKKAEVEAVCRRLSGAKNGAPEWLAAYQTALKEVTEELSAEELADFTEKAKEWTEKSPPEAEQRK